jgi:endonuclease/exonuclease/phosphatase (EEP) superfamily protein YafD
MNLWRFLLGGAGVWTAGTAAIAVALGLFGAVWGWADLLNHFAPVWLAFAVFGGLLGAAALRPSHTRTGLLAVAAFAAVGAGAPMFYETARGALTAWSTARPAGPVLKVLTFNMLWNNPELDSAAALIRRADADLVALQETTRLPLIEAQLADLYPYRFYCGGRCDTAILSKRPFLAQGREPGAAWPEGANLIWVRVQAPDGRPATFAVAHLYWPIPGIQPGQRAKLAALARPLAAGDLVLAGDFNLSPWSFALRELDHTLSPLTRRTRGLLTFPAEPFPTPPILAIDQLYAARAWRTVEVRRLPKAGSDHYPVLAVLAR